LKNIDIPVELTGISEIDIDAILSYDAIHNTINKSYPDYSIEQMRQYLINRNIGYDFKKKKSRIPRLKKNKIQKLFQACINTNNYGDISLIKPDDLPNFDLFNFTFSCQSVSVAGKQTGMKDKDGNITRTGQYIYGIDIIRTKKPKYILIENVKGLISKKFINDFYNIINEIESIGYNCYYPKNNKGKPRCLNAKDYGIPQNRERIYVICIRKDIDKYGYTFPNGFDNGTRLKDILEKEVDEKYYISQDKTNKLLEQLMTNDIGINPCLTPDRINKRQSNNQNRNTVLESNNIDVIGKLEIKGKDNIRRVYNPNGISPALTTMEGGSRQPKVIENIDDKTPKPELVGGIGEINFGKQYRQGNRVYSSDKTAMCLMAQPVGNTGGFSYLYQIGYRIRKLTPRECWRLMSFDDEDIDKCIAIGISNTSLYKQAGNSIVVKVLEEIFKSLFII
ncbi:MAG: DNA cytosine methyltransferase, partial [Bacillota bacterium]|nr:DNA cytosine methyltransferase [Bacillota bacterium]